jgi:LPXTG-motif cell wall-anchored protein
MNHVPTIRRHRRARAGALLAAVTLLSVLSIANGPVAAAQPDSGVVSSPQGGTSDAETMVEPEPEPEPEPVVAGAAVGAAAIGPPAVTATPTSGLNPAGGSTITVTGSGFDPNANSKFGVYAVFGPVDPATYFSDANRFLAAVWLHPGGGASGSPGQGELNPDGTFSATLPPVGGLPLTASYTDGNGAAVNCMTTQCYVVTMAAHGVADRSMDTCTPVSFAGATATPQVDRSCRPVATPTGNPTTGDDDSSGRGPNTTANPAGASGTGSGSTGDGTGSGATLPKTGSSVAWLGGLGVATLASGLLLVGRDRRSRRNSPAVALVRGPESGG